MFKSKTKKFIVVLLTIMFNMNIIYPQCLMVQNVFAALTEANLSQGKTATASSDQPAVSASMGNDGNTTTRWAAAGPLNQEAYNPSWWKVDLGTVYPIKKVITSWYSSSNRSYKYKIEVSNDDKTYTVAVDKTANTTMGDSTDMFVANGRYVRITITGGSNMGGNASFYECAVWGYNNTPVVKQAPNFTYQDGNNTAVSQFVYAKSVKVNTNIWNDTVNNITPVLITALYDQHGTMKDITADSKTILSDQQASFTTVMTNSSTYPDGYYAQAYVWDSVYGNKTYSDPILAPGTSAFSQLASGSEAKGYSIDPNTQVATIKGNLGSMVANKPVILQVFNIGKQMSDIDLSHSETLKQVFYHIYQTKADASGNYVFKFGMNAKTGTYTALVVSEDMAPVQITYDYSNPSDLTDAINGINIANDIQTIRDVITGYKKVLGLNLPLYDDLTSKTAVYQELLNHKPYSNSTQVQKIFNYGVVLEAINEATEKEQMKVFLTDYPDIMLLNTESRYTLYNAFSGDVQDEICQSLVDANKYDYLYNDVPKDPNKINNFKSNFLEKVCITLFNNVHSWGELHDLLNTNNDIFGIDFTDYSQKLTDKYRNDVDKEMVHLKTNKKFSSIKEIVDEFNETVNEAIKQKQNDEKSTSHSPTGGGGRTTVTSSADLTVIPIITPTTSSTTFEDLHGVEWAANSINNLAAKGIVKGFENRFMPQDAVTREEFITMIIQGFGLVNNIAECTFNDVEKGAWYYQYIASAEKLELTNGLGNRDFGIGREISRQEMSVMAYRVALLKGLQMNTIEPAVTFIDDDQIDDYAKKAITVMQQAGIINGMDNAFVPKDNATRAQAAVILDKLLKFIK